MASFNSIDFGPKTPRWCFARKVSAELRATASRQKRNFTKSGSGEIPGAYAANSAAAAWRPPGRLPAWSVKTSAA